MSDPFERVLRKSILDAPGRDGRDAISIGGGGPMAVPSVPAAVPAVSVAGAVNTLRARGLRLSSARRVLLEALFAAGRPVTAEELARGLGGRVPPSDLASVYRNLETLERHGLARHLQAGRGPGRWLPAGERSDYALCERCDRMTALAPGTLDAVREAIRCAIGFEATFANSPLPGVCPACHSLAAGALIG
jgi:Fur family transcriptional regulator, ferric uptake regulator